ncbi:hypothetical protein A2U01_0001748, partial [Trifolium medium]|nr:hypothetical protein [Trifolium medium]
GLGAVAIDDSGTMVAVANWQRLGGQDVNEAEATSLLLAIQFAHDIGWKR